MFEDSEVVPHVTGILNCGIGSKNNVAKRAAGGDMESDEDLGNRAELLMESHSFKPLYLISEWVEAFTIPLFFSRTFTAFWCACRLPYQHNPGRYDFAANSCVAKGAI